MKRGVRTMLFLLSFALLLTGCQKADVPQKEPEQPAPAVEESAAENSAEKAEGEAQVRPFTLGYYAELGLSPYTCSNTTNQAIIRLLYEPLYENTPDFDTETCLARDLSLDGEGYWNLTLREGIRFWNGDALTAEDVVYSLNRAKRSDSLYAQRLNPMRELEAADELTVRFQWNKVRGDLTPLLEIPIVQSGSARFSVPMGTGAYEPVIEEKRLTALQANDDWWQGLLVPRQNIPLYRVKDSDELIYGFESGSVSMVSTDLTDSNALVYAGNAEVWDYNTGRLLYLGCNTADGITAQREFRQALQAAVDRETMAQRLLSGHAVPTALTFHPESAYYDETLSGRISKANASLLRRWKGEDVTLLVNVESDFKCSIADEVAKLLREQGIFVRVEKRFWSDYLSALEAGEYHLYIGETLLEPDFDPGALVSADGELNFSGFASDEVKSALSAYRKAGRSTRAEKAGALSLAIAEEAPVIPLCFEARSILSHWGIIQQYSATQSNLFCNFTEWTIRDPS